MIQKLIPALLFSFCLLVVTSACEKKDSTPDEPLTGNSFTARMKLVSEKTEKTFKATGNHVIAAAGQQDGKKLMTFEFSDDASPQKLSLIFGGILGTGTYRFGESDLEVLGFYYKDSTKSSTNEGDLYVIANSLTDLNGDQVHPRLELQITSLTDQGIKGKLNADLYNFTSGGLGSPDIDWMMQIENGVFDCTWQR